ncbi:MAG: gliding motility lipoprotein GldH [Bacteroidetes bacterium]|jgi:gliding motility-associated lipoprotein GldH|nr:gliding motility lipoprotein GldH [Bacteroidota bacterium]
MYRSKRIRKTFCSAAILMSIVLFSSCNDNRIFEENKAIPESGWDTSNVVSFNVEIKDPSTPANFFVNVRNADGYPYSNLFLFVKTKFPNGKQSNDTLECMLADDNGKWIGKGIGDIYDNRIPFKRNVRFPIAGNYIFEIQQGMRVSNVPLIMDIGLRIEKAE